MEQTDAGRRFAEWLRELITQRGYDLTLRGEQSRFVRDSGIPTATVSRILSGQGADIRTLASLAEKLRVPLGLVLVKAGTLTEADLYAAQNPAPEKPLTTDEAADQLGIHDPQARSVFAATVDALRTTNAKRTAGKRRRAEN
ncbi:helix-turn-helix domain-containing protein [Streptomyces zhihengii]